MSFAYAMGEMSAVVGVSGSIGGIGVLPLLPSLGNTASSYSNTQLTLRLERGPLTLPATLFPN